MNISKSNIQSVVDDTIRSRKSIRAFLPELVSLEVVADILEVAARAPSGTNMQPWKVYVLQQPTIDAVCGAIQSSGIRPERAKWDDYRYYPKRFVEPYLTRRREVGAALHRSLGIQRHEATLLRRQVNKNFSFFGAPIGLFVCIDRSLETGSWLDLGMFIQNFLIAAQSRGLSTCAQAAFAPFHKFIRPIIGMPDDEILVCGVALGYADRQKPENSLKTGRAGLSEWVQFVGDKRLERSGKEAEGTSSND